MNVFLLIHALFAQANINEVLTEADPGGMGGTRPPPSPIISGDEFF